jgi:protoporphyrin/coproporphyrin ferrochelatase
MPARPKKRAVVLFNLGGPDEPSAIQPFLFNLFNDPAIISLPQPLRWCLAKLISKRRSPIAQKIYAEIGGRSPLLDLTREQAAALEDQLGTETEVFISMRYWHPLSASTAKAVKNYDPDEIILLPLYPQFSTTTTGSSLEDWHRSAREIGLHKPTKSICCYPAETNLIKAQAKLLAEHLAPQSRVLFSAHGLPKKMIDKGDPYQWQIEQTAAAIAAEADLQIDQWRICYQSRVGRLEWIGPSLDEELERAAADNIGVTILPIAFVSEHSETLVELDIEYREMADKLKLPAYNRVPAVGTQPDFISGLAKLVESASVSKHNLISGFSNLAGRNCPADRIGCPQ